MLTNFLVLVFLICGTTGLIAFSRKRFEECIPITFMLIILAEFVFGVLGVLKTGFYVSIILLLISGVFSIIWSLKKSTFKKNITLLFTPGFVIFIITYILLSIINVGKLASIWDEFSHWMDVVKVTTMLDDFATNPNSHSMFKSYPPAMNLIQYFVQRFNMLIHGDVGFSEWRAYFTYQIFSLSFFFPFFKNFSFKKPIENIFVILGYFLCILFFFGEFYSSVYIDAVLSIVTGCTIASILLQENKKELLHSFRVFLSCATLILLKDAGMLFAVFIILIYIISIYEKSFLRNKNSIILSISALLSIILPKLLWKIELATSHAYVSFGKKISPLVLLNVIIGKDTSYRREVLKNYLSGFFNRNISIGHTGINLNYFIVLLISFILIHIVYNIMKKESLEKEVAKNNIYPIILCFMILIYIVGLLNTYMVNFSEYEAVHIASFARYMNICFATIWVSFIIVFTQKSCLFEKNKPFVLLIFITVIFSIIPSKDFASFISRQTVYNSAAIRSLYIPLNEEIKKFCKEEEKVYFISQGDTGFDNLVATFNARPVVIIDTGAWSIGIPDTEDDMYTQYISCEDWQKKLIEEFDYVAIYKLNNYFIQEYFPIFDDVILENHVYKVNKDTGRLSLCQ